jgi:WD repeat-containing protein 1 (actin-interacting protein 1)
VTAAHPTGPGTFLAGTATGRVLSFSATGEASPVGGDGHSNLVTSLSSGKDGKVFSSGFDDRLREIDGPTFTFVGLQINVFQRSHPVTGQLHSPRSPSRDLSQLEGMDLCFWLRSMDWRLSGITRRLLNSRLPSLQVRSMSMVLWWPLGERWSFSHSYAKPVVDDRGTQDTKVRLYDWDGKSLKETGVLEGNRGPVSAIRFSPDGTMVVSGDVSCTNFLRFT